MLRLHERGELISERIDRSGPLCQQQFVHLCATQLVFERRAHFAYSMRMPAFRLVFLLAHFARNSAGFGLCCSAPLRLVLDLRVCASALHFSLRCSFCSALLVSSLPLLYTCLHLGSAFPSSRTTSTHTNRVKDFNVYFCVLSSCRHTKDIVASLNFLKKPKSCVSRCTSSLINYSTANLN